MDQETLRLCLIKEKVINGLFHSIMNYGMVRSVQSSREMNSDVTNQDVLNAIHYHTTGRAGMSNLEKIIYVADMIEPGRNFPGVEN